MLQNLMSEITLKKAIIERKSIREFSKKKISQKKLNNIFKLAQNSPSNCNIQPWFTYACSGVTKQKLSKKMLKNEKNKIKPNPDYSYPSNFLFNLDYLKRQVDCAKQLYDTLGIKREDKATRYKAFLKNYEFYNAPHVCFIGMHENFGSSIALDVGIYVQNLLLAMKYYGVSSCPQATLRNFPDLIRKELKIPTYVKILLGISFGYANKKALINKTNIVKSDLNKNVNFFQ